MMECTGTIFDLRRFCIHDGPGIRTTVFFKGCPLDCWWCHNPESRSPSIEAFPPGRTDSIMTNSHRLSETTFGRVVTVSEIVREVMRDEPFYDQSRGGVTFSGGEPMAQIDFLDDLLEACKAAGLHCTIDTCGHASLVDFERVCNRTDLFLFDLKLIDPKTHRNYTGVSNEIILANLTALARLGNNIEVRLPLIPEITDTTENLEAVADFLRPFGSIQRISLLPYNKLGEDKVRRLYLPRRKLELETQSSETLERQALIFRKCGFEVRIGG